jgi:hypothetical protein
VHGSRPRCGPRSAIPPGESPGSTRPSNAGLILSTRVRYARSRLSASPSRCVSEKLSPSTKWSAKGPWFLKTRKQAIAEIFDASHELDPYHELAHVVVGSLGTPRAMFDEGLATYMQQSEVWLGHTIDSWAKSLGDRGKLFPLAELFAFADIGSVETCPLVSYPQSGSVIKFLTQLGGWPAMQRALRELRNGDDPSIVSTNRELFQAIFGLELAEAERRWLGSLDSAEVEAVPTARIDAIECR